MWARWFISTTAFGLKFIIIKKFQSINYKGRCINRNAIEQIHTNMPISQSANLLCSPETDSGKMRRVLWLIRLINLSTKTSNIWSKSKTGTANLQRGDRRGIDGYWALSTTDVRLLCMCQMLPTSFRSSRLHAGNGGALEAVRTRIRCRFGDNLFSSAKKHVCLFSWVC